MTKAIVGGMLAVLGAAGPVVAQQDGVATRVSAQFGGKFQDAECQIKSGHFLVSSAKTKLSSYSTTSDPVIGGHLLRDGTEIIREATTNKGQDKNPAAWYWLGRINLAQGDIPGADSAFTRAATLAQQCESEIQKYRTRAWSALMVGAQEFVEQKNIDSARILYRAANRINGTAPHGFVALAGIFYDAGQTDSALIYFDRAAATNPAEPAYVKLRNQAAFNAAVILLNSSRYGEAVAAFHRYLGLEPADVAAKKALAKAFRGAGMPDSAQALERFLVANAGADSGGAAGEDGVSEDDLMGIAGKQFDDKNYKEAAATFGRVLALNPASRDALFNLANSYLAMEQGGDIAAAAGKLIQIEPLSEYAYSLQAQGYKLAGDQDGLFKAVVAREALVVNVEIQSMKITADGATLLGKITGRDARDENNKQIPPRELTIVVEFPGEGGVVVASQEVKIAALKAGETAEFSATGKGAGVKGWRYHVK